MQMLRVYRVTLLIQRNSTYHTLLIVSVKSPVDAARLALLANGVGVSSGFIAGTVGLLEFRSLRRM